MPYVDKECEGNGATHHYACHCREQYFRKIEACVTQVLYQWDALGKYKDDDFGKVESEMEKLRSLLKKLEE